MEKLAISVSFRYVDPQLKEPGPSRQFVNQHIAVPAGSHLPRIGEAVELLHWDANRDIRSGIYSVLFVHTRIALYDSAQSPSGWHTMVTVGPLDPDSALLLTGPL